MTDRHLHIISFDVPWPADYGGVIDVFYKIKALHALGVKIHLHCYHYGRKESNELKAYCEEVHYYPRNMNRTLLMHPMPFIVVSRQQDALLHRLMQDQYPILFEGKHTTYYLDHPDLVGRKKYLRAHNVEEDYYRGLAKSERNPLKKWYLKKESKKLKNHRHRLAAADHIFAISKTDAERFSSVAPTDFIGPFHANEEAVYQEEKQAFCFYHGNLSVGENIDAAFFLIQEVFNNLDVELRIFGKGAPKRLLNEVKKYKHISISSGTQTELEQQLREAQINVLPTFQSTGMKLKLLYSLFNGGHVLVNPQMVVGTGAESLVCIAENTEDFQNEVLRLMGIRFSKEAFEKRKLDLEKQFAVREQAMRIYNRIYSIGAKGSED